MLTDADVALLLLYLLSLLEAMTQLQPLSPLTLSFLQPYSERWYHR